MTTVLFLQNLGATEIVIIALVVLLLFGGRKIPELMKGLGKGVKSFKQGMNDVENEIHEAVEDADKSAVEAQKEKNNTAK